jgi:linoleoyl-CoA desaturase
MQTVKFSKIDPSQFFKTTRHRVNQYFDQKQLSRAGTYRIYIKSAVMISLYLVPFILMLSGVITGWWTVLGYTIMGLGTAGVGLCVMHDANHGTFSKYKVINKIMGYSLNMIGGSSFTWKVQHNVLHHSFTNIYQLDEDIDDKPFLRLSPHGKKRPYHRFQHIYAWGIYSLATVSWILFKDFKQLFLYHNTGITEDTGFNPRNETIALIASKSIYVGLVLILPMILAAKWYIILLGFLIMHIVAGWMITVIFQLAHVVEGADHHHLEKKSELDNTWALHQLSTTANFANRNRVLTWFIGGLNFQIEHHLFPHISHIHYPEIAKIVKKTAQECGLKYNEFVTVLSAMKSHARMLKQIGVA